MASGGGDDDFAVEDTPGYKAPAKVDLETLQNLDKDDEALNRWKAKLLEGASAGATDDPRKVVVEKMTFVAKDGPELELDLTGDIKDLKKKPFTIKEGCEFRIKISFRVQHDVVPGLCYASVVKRKGITVPGGKQKYMLGSYGPKSETQTALTPWDVMPSGMLARGHYTIHSRFIDDDKECHLDWEWSMDLKKDWI